jgi:hypothetical protein
MLLKHLVTDSEVDAKKLIKLAVRAVDHSKAKACAAYGRKQIEKQHVLLN